MIDEEHYTFPHEEQKRQHTEEELRQAKETLEYLESLPWRPFGIDW